MRKITAFFVALAMLTAAVLSLFLSSGGSQPVVADGQVLSVQARTALWGIKQAVSGAGGTFILQKNDMFMFFWGQDGGIYFVVVDTAKKAAIESLQQVVDCGGNYANCKTFTELFKALTEAGWTKTLPAALPKVFYNAVSQSPAAWLMSLANGTMPTFVFVPAAMLNQPSILKTVYPQIGQ